MKEKIKQQLTNLIQQAAQWCDEGEIFEATKEWADSIQLKQPEQEKENDKDSSLQ
jgi:hypothetical protein